MRLDQFLVQERLAQSRSQAKELIVQGKVASKGVILHKPSLEICVPFEVQILQKVFVSRAGEKLWDYLASHPINCTDWVILDVGASKGGFAQVLLEKGARRVVCVDVGTNQLDMRLRVDSRVQVVEQCDIRAFVPTERYDLLTCDVSFISLSKILKVLCALSHRALLLFKPQFEVGREVKRNKAGVVCDEARIQARLAEMCAEIEALGGRVRHICPCKLKGKAGNAEFFIYFEQ
ncbi:23S rRNA (cytidine-2'-O)-methyltransferase TlyA [Helicobacter cynogastricus]|uniref:23S rRNA (cytidine-2'-O)-methyltransferase TlyA n=1 Tax=Helicobacter cynogastricus TaxID=329937 RepID=UPI000CF119D0|nr:TlyA family RNA methyltransferase [Helicobacter cynogastricus]